MVNFYHGIAYGSNDTRSAPTVVVAPEVHLLSKFECWSLPDVSLNYALNSSRGRMGLMVFNCSEALGIYADRNARGTMI